MNAPRVLRPIFSTSWLIRGCALDQLSDEVAWNLVAPLFRQKAPVVMSALLFTIVAVTGFIGTGSWLYPAELAVCLVLVAGRLHQCHAFERRRHVATPTQWAGRSLLVSWLTGAGWGSWALVVWLEPRPGLSAMVLGILSALTLSGAIRNNSVEIIARGQIILASMPLYLGCLGANDPYVHLYACLVALNMFSALTLNRYLHEEKLRALLSEVQALELSAKLGVANEELALVNQHLKEQVATDPLTGLLNRRALDLAAAREWRTAKREERQLAVLMMDVDHFKSFNDHYGHQAGDKCLRSIADALTCVLHRPGDLLARYGGEEFIAVLPSTDTEGALAVAEAILAQLAERRIAHARTPLGRVSVSIGIACASSGQALSLPTLIEHADKALYDAKRGGRNRLQVHVHDPVDDLSVGPPADDLDVLFFSEQDEFVDGR